MLYTTLPHYLMKSQLLDLKERTFKHELNNGTFSIKMYDKRDDFDFVFFLFFDGDIPRSPSYSIFYASTSISGCYRNSDTVAVRPYLVSSLTSEWVRRTAQFRSLDVT